MSSLSHADQLCHKRGREIPKSVSGGVRNPYTQSFGVVVQRQLTSNVLLDIAYIGAFGRKLIILRAINPAVYGPGATVRNTSARRIYAPVFDSIGGLFSDGNSEYNSLQVTLTKRLQKRPHVRSGLHLFESDRRSAIGR